MHSDEKATLLYPSKMLYPTVLPLMSMFDAFFHDGANTRRRLKVFYLVFGAYVALHRSLLTCGLPRNLQHLYLGALPAMDVPPSHWLVDHVPCCSEQRNRLPSVRWKQR